MPAWPRAIRPNGSSPPLYPGGLQSWGLSGKGQLRAIGNAGRIWTETYRPFDLQSADGRAFIAAINEFWRNGIIFDIQHLLYKARYGAGGGAPLVNGAAQTGSLINLDGCPVSTPNWLRQGDILRFAGLNPVYDITANVNTTAGGAAAIPINPPIFVGGSPADNAVVTIDNVLFRAVIHERPELPQAGVVGILADLTLVFREAV
jgi:hypothetical protein